MEQGVNERDKILMFGLYMVIFLLSIRDMITLLIV